MRRLEATERRAERVRMVRTLLGQHQEMKAGGRMNLSELEWVLFRLGCSSAEAEKLVALAKEPEAGG